MLNQDIDEVLFNEEGKVTGIKAGDKVARAPLVVCDPSYVVKQGKFVKPIGKIVRSICILDHPIPDTSEKTSCMVIIPQKQIPG